MDWLEPALWALFGTFMMLGPVNIYMVTSESRPRFRAVVWLFLWLFLSAIFAFAAQNFVELKGFSIVIYIGLSLFFAYHAINKILFLIYFGKRFVVMDDKAVYVLGLDLMIPWQQLVSIDVDHGGVKFVTTLARSEWFVDMPQAKARQTVDSVVAHKNYRKLDPYVNVN